MLLKVKFKSRYLLCYIQPLVSSYSSLLPNKGKKKVKAYKSSISLFSNIVLNTRYSTLIKKNKKKNHKYMTRCCKEYNRSLLLPNSLLGMSFVLNILTIHGLIFSMILSFLFCSWLYLSKFRFVKITLWFSSKLQYDITAKKWYIIFVFSNGH